MIPLDLLFCYRLEDSVSKRNHHEAVLNKWILLMFAVGLALTGLMTIYFTAWPPGYLLFGLIIGYLADPIRNALESSWVTFTAEEVVKASNYSVQALRPSPANSPLEDAEVSETQTDLSDKLPDSKSDLFEGSYPQEIWGNATNPEGIPPLPGESLSPEARESLLQRTDHTVVNNRCVVCSYRSSLLDHYPYDPRFHYRECYVPELRSLVDQIILCPQRLIESHYQESEQ